MKQTQKQTVLHEPVLLDEVLTWLQPTPGKTYLDVTSGYGGHAGEILERITPGGCLWGIDVDPVEIKRAEARIRAQGYGEVTVDARVRRPCD